MHTISNKRPLRELLSVARQEGKSIALVPTMGNLHEGHLQLVQTAKSKADFVVCTIFVNPLQFGAGEDLDAYPRTLGEDIAQLTSVGCDCLFIPTITELYNNGLDNHTRVQVPELTADYCGKSRPGHFDGVTTIVCKLFNLIQPNAAVFGLKDYQQFLIIRKMIADMEFDIDLIGVEIQREANGLALSSRNRYLNDTQQQKAAMLYQCLLDIEKRIQKGNRDFPSLETLAIERLHETGFEVDYFAIANANTLSAASKTERNFVILSAVQVGPSRLIDNVRFILQD